MPHATPSLGVQAVEAAEEREQPTLVPKYNPEEEARVLESMSSSEEEGEERPTVVPAFDPETFARESEVRQRAALAPSTSTVDEARKRLKNGDADGALVLVTRLLEVAPLDAEGLSLAQECRTAIERDCLTELGGLGTMLVVAVSPGELRGYGLDHLTGFLVSLLDGNTDIETVLDLCGAPRLLALRSLRDLASRGIIQPPRRRA